MGFQIWIPANKTCMHQIGLLCFLLVAHRLLCGFFQFIYFTLQGILIHLNSNTKCWANWLALLLGSVISYPVQFFLLLNIMRDAA